jgi:hypothetical protein
MKNFLAPLVLLAAAGLANAAEAPAHPGHGRRTEPWPALAPVDLRADTSKLSAGDRVAIAS